AGPRADRDSARDLRRRRVRLRDSRRDFRCSGRTASDSSGIINCHPERSEGPMNAAMRGSFASLKRTTKVVARIYGPRHQLDGGVGDLADSPVARIERDIQFEHVHARLTQESPLPVLRVLENQVCDFSFGNLALRSHTPNLELR